MLYVYRGPSAMLMLLVLSACIFGAQSLCNYASRFCCWREHNGIIKYRFRVCVNYARC